MLAAALAHAAEAGAELDALDGVDAHQPVREIGFELVEHGLAEPDGHSLREHVDARADRVARAAQLDHEALELLELRGVRAEERIVVDDVEIHGIELERAEARQVAADPHADTLGQILACDRACRDAHDGFPRRRAAAAAVIADAVLVLVGVIGVAGPETVLDLRVVARALVDVLDEQPDRRARRDALEDARQDAHLVGLLALRDVAAPARAPALEIGLDRRLVEREPGRATVDDAAERRAVALAEGRHLESLSVAVTGHRSRLVSDEPPSLLPEPRAPGVP